MNLSLNLKKNMYSKGEIRMKNFKEAEDYHRNCVEFSHSDAGNYNECVYLALKIADKLQSGEVSDVVALSILGGVTTEDAMEMTKKTFNHMATQLIQECKEEKE